MRNQPPVTVSDLAAIDWRGLIAGKSSVSEISQVFNEATQAAETVSSGSVNAFRFLAILTSFRPTYDSRESKYRGLYEGAITPSDLDSSDFVILEDMLSAGVEQPDLRARIADLIWCYQRPKNPVYARLAISAFNEAEQVLGPVETRHSEPRRSRLSRLVQISYQLGEDKPEYAQAIHIIKEALEAARSAAKPWVCVDYLGILFGFSAGDAVYYAEFCEVEAVKLEAKGDFTWAYRYWKARLGWLKSLGDEGVLATGRLRAAESLVLESAAAVAISYGLAKTKLAQAIESLRRCEAPPSRIEELRLLHREYSQRSLAEFKPMQGADKIYRDAAEAVMPEAIQGVKGKSFESALIWIAGFYQATDVAKLRSEIVASASRNPLFLFGGTEYVDSAGRTTGRTAGGLELGEERMRAKMYDFARECIWPLKCVAVLTAVEQIMVDHNPRPEDLEFLVRPNPLIDPSREFLVIRGLLAGLRGDWVLSTHLLIPQVEHLFRYVLAQHGKISTHLDGKGIEQVHSLEKLLRENPDLDSLLGPDLMFDFRGILIERAGHNLRNRMAHGLMGEGEFYRHGAFYLWWLMLHLLCCPFFAAVQAQGQAEASGSETTQ